ncbi:HK97 gp10 family phage protein [Roseibium sp.]|uniref:HK97 gp10 family phage protein n=1 Tax=Roseibium sp. TaxID=1936156 RepID=UPI003B5083C5
MSVTYKVAGLRAVERSLKALNNHVTARSVARRVLKRAAAPVAEKAALLAPDDPATPGNDLKASIGVSTRLTKRQRRAVRKTGKNAVEVYAGTSDPAGVQQEFGNVNHGAQPFLRPAWLATKMHALAVVTRDLTNEVTKTARRAAARSAKRR